MTDPKDLLSLQGKLLAGRFQLIRLLGQGGYGAVFEAEQISIGRRCAVKVLAPRDVSDAKTTERFKMEARATSRLSHPNTVTIYDFGHDGELGVLFLAMEYLEGRDLSSVMKAGELDVATSVRIIEQACASLDDAHSHGIVHRDVKPQNIMVIPRGQDAHFVKMIDFGIAKAFSENGIQPNTQLTMTGTIIGTPQYMSPEQVRDIEMDGRSDQYSLAVCLYQMLTGRPPFLGSSPIDIATRHLTDEPLPPGVLRPDLNLPNAFEEAVLKALSKSPEDRFKTLDAFASALRNGLRNEGSGPKRSTEDVPVLSTQTLDIPVVTTEPVAVEDSRLPTTEVGKKPDPTVSAPAYGTEAIDVSSESAPVLAQHSTDEVRTTRPKLIFDEDGVVPEGKGHTVAVHAPDLSLAFSDSIPSPLAASSKSTPKWPVLGALVIAVLGVGAWYMWPTTGTPPEPLPAVQTVVSAKPDPPVAPKTNLILVEDTPEPSEKPELDETESILAQDIPVVEKPIQKARKNKVEEKPVEPPVVMMGKVSVTLIPWGNLYVGTKNMGDQTRHSLELPEGKHRLSLRQDGETRVVKTVDVVAGQTKMVVLNANAP